VAYGQGVTNVNEPEAAALPVTPFRRAPQPSWRNRLWLLRRFIRLQRRLRRGHTSLPVRAGLPSRSQWTHWVFTDAQTLQLVRACRKQRTSLNALLIAVVCHALRDGLGERDAAFPCIVPFDIRRLFESGGESEIGSFIGVMSALVDVAEDGSLWDAARTAHEEIESFQAHDGPASVYNLAARMANAAFTRALPQVLDARRPALLATYYGVLPWADRYGNLTLGGATLDAGNQMAGPHLVIEGLVLGKKLNVGFSASGLEPSFWEELQRRVGEVLLCAGEGT
jgi:hypothetical protein